MSQDFDAHSSIVFAEASPSRASSIPVSGEPVTAFVGPAPRGPVDHAVSIRSLADFEKQFGAPDFHCRMEFAIRQFFANGGRNAVVVRVAGSMQCNRIHLPSATSPIVLQACNPGPLEFLRASIDIDGIAADDELSFNLVVQRLRTENSVWIDEQEYFRGLTIDAGSRDYFGKILAQSLLVRLVGEPPASRPLLTIKPGSLREAGYVGIHAQAISSPAPNDYDLVGSGTAGTGLSALDGLSDVAYVCLISGAKDAALGPVAMLAAERFCRLRQALLIIDPPSRWQSVSDVVSDQYRSAFASPNAVTWFPCARIRNASGERVLTSATGSIAAALLQLNRTRQLERVHDDDLLMQRGGLRLDSDVSIEDRIRLARVGVNTLIQRSAVHNQLLGDVTQARHANVIGGHDGLEQRQDVLFVLRRLREGTRWIAFNESNPRVWRALREQVMDFIATLREAGVLAGTVDQQAGFVQCDNVTNQQLTEAHSVTFMFGIALSAPGEFLTYRIQQSPQACRVHELGRPSELALAG
jgi:hypothetical protein